MLERLAGKSKTGWLMGSYGCEGMTYCDVSLMEGLEAVVTRDPNVLDKFPHLAQLHAKLRALPRLKEFLESDRRKSKGPDGIEEHVASVKRTIPHVFDL